MESFGQLDVTHGEFSATIMITFLIICLAAAIYKIHMTCVTFFTDLVIASICWIQPFD